MAGRGPTPKPSSTRVRRNKQPVTEQVIEVEAGTQPDLPDLMPMMDPDGENFGVQWPAATARWWNMWAEHPIAETFTDSDWSFLLDTALLHGAYWSGDLKVAAELRQRRCTGCRLELNGADLRDIAAAPEDEVLRCPDCGRILVRTPESGL